MKRLIMLVGLLCCAHIGIAQDADWKNAEEVGLSEASPEGAVIQAILALKSHDKEAFINLCSDKFKATEKKMEYMRYNGLCKAVEIADPDQEFMYKVTVLNEEDSKYLVESKISRTGKFGHISIRFKMQKFDDKYLITGI